jgi:hypothetical protein
LTATVSDNVGVANCDLNVGGYWAGTMSISGNVTSLSYAFATPGSYSVFATCRDTSGNTTGGAPRTITISLQTNMTAGIGSLMKLACPDGAPSDHPCRAVYYYGADNKRHAFPNEHIFFTWYSDFSSVIEVSGGFMSTLPLGKNVTYRPGIRMVKVATVPRVYAVSLHGVLRWVTTETVAAALYGSYWNTHIDDLSDSLFFDYTYGNAINSASDFDLAHESAAAVTIDANF